MSMSCDVTGGCADVHGCVATTDHAEVHGMH